MSKDPLDFNFDDISGKQNKEIKKGKTSDLSGIILSIPIRKNGKKLLGKFLVKDLCECTSEEFYDWVCEVYPYKNNRIKPSQFKSRTERTAAFRQVSAYWASLMAPKERETFH